jgi:cytosine/adenosine deaminase-related metal-dependent hydrolase
VIVSVGAAADVCAAHPDLPERPLGDVVLMPGLVDAHCHLEWSLLEGLLPSAGFGSWLRAFLPIRERMAPDDHAVAARYGALRALKAGTTTVADSGPMGAGADALKEMGLAGIVHLEAFGRESGDKAREMARATAARILELEADAGPRIALGLSPHAPYTVGPEFWKALAENADLAKRPWATHLAESPDETRLLSHDEGPLADLFRDNGWQPGRWTGSGGGSVSRVHAGGGLRAGLVAAHCVRLDPSDPEMLARMGVAVAHCPESNSRLRCGRAPVEALVAAGVAVGIGTDSPASAGLYDVRAEARAVAREAEAAGVAAPDAATLVTMATLGGAMALGLDREIGSLEAGKRCDLVAVCLTGDGGDDPFGAALDARSRIETVVIGGVERVRGGATIDLDEDHIEHRARDARTRIGRVPG